MVINLYNALQSNQPVGTTIPTNGYWKLVGASNTNICEENNVSLNDAYYNINNSSNIRILSTDTKLGNDSNVNFIFTYPNQFKYYTFKYYPIGCYLPVTLCLELKFSSTRYKFRAILDNFNFLPNGYIELRGITLNTKYGSLYAQGTGNKYYLNGTHPVNDQTNMTNFLVTEINNLVNTSITSSPIYANIKFQASNLNGILLSNKDYAAVPMYPLSNTTLLETGTYPILTSSPVDLTSLPFTNVSAERWLQIETDTELESFIIDVNFETDPTHTFNPIVNSDRGVVRLGSLNQVTATNSSYITGTAIFGGGILEQDLITTISNCSTSICWNPTPIIQYILDPDEWNSLLSFPNISCHSNLTYSKHNYPTLKEILPC